MMNILDTKLLSFISKNRVSFMLVVLLVGNVYQYIDNKALVAQANTDKKELNEKMLQREIENAQYERIRSEKLELLLSTLAKPQDNGKSNDNSH